MQRTKRSFVGMVVVAGLLLATTVAAVAETCTLTIKRRDAKSGVNDRMSNIYWSARPQYFVVQMNPDANGEWRVANPGENSDAFKRIVRKEPKYTSAHPYRGVIKFGTQEYAFALDAVPETKPEAKKPEAQESRTAAIVRLAISSEASTPATKAGGASTGEKPRPKPAPLKDFAYNRLYFDFNHNGDLSDDKVLETSADAKPTAPIFSSGMRRFNFPRIDVAISVDGIKVDHSFYLEGYAYSSPSFCNVYISVNSAVCREGNITLNGKQHHIVLIDYNCNGRFDDRSKVSENIHLASGQLYAEMGDMLLVDPKPATTAYDSLYDPTTNDYRYYISDMILIDGRWYDLRISPAGDKLTLTASEVPTGNVTSRNKDFCALLYGVGKGFVKIRGTKGTPIPMPEGDWKLFSYTITAEAAKLAEKETAEKAAPAKGSLLAALGQVANSTVAPLSGPTLASATATDKYKAVTVHKGETVELPFGPPYTPTVTAATYTVANANGKTEQQTYLTMTLIGAGGEACTNMLIKGGRPGKPEFTITDPDGKVVQQGSFEYG
jgi:hypothetical protein